MVTSRRTIEALLHLQGSEGRITAKKMFGEYGLYFDGKLIGLVCDGELFIKPTAEGRKVAGTLDERPPYPGAKPSLLVPGDAWDDAEWMLNLLQISATALPPPRPKKKRARA